MDVRGAKELVSNHSEGDDALKSQDVRGVRDYSRYNLRKRILNLESRVPF